MIDCRWWWCIIKAQNKKMILFLLLLFFTRSIYSDSSLCHHLCSPICSSADCLATCTSKCSKSTPGERPGVLSPWIAFQGAIQHVGITTSNLSRSVQFYTKVMGGVEVVGAGGDGWKGDDVYQLLMQAALVRGGAIAGWAADLSANGTESMDARYIAFDSVVIELLDYHSDEAALQRSLLHDTVGIVRQTFPVFTESNFAPSVAGNMHVSFQVRPGRDLNEFVTQLEISAASLGFDEVLCNRLVPVPLGGDGRPNVTGVPSQYNSYAVTNGSFEGWSLAYCKGPDGEQLEFNKVQRNASEAFEQALRTYLSGGENPIW